MQQPDGVEALAALCEAYLHACSTTVDAATPEARRLAHDIRDRVLTRYISDTTRRLSGTTDSRTWDMAFSTAARTLAVLAVESRAPFWLALDTMSKNEIDKEAARIVAAHHEPPRPRAGKGD